MARLTQNIPELHRALTNARHADVMRVVEALQSFSVTVVHGEPEVGTTSVVEAAVRAHGALTIRVDLDGAASEADVAHLVARGMALAAIGPVALSHMHAGEALRPTSSTQAYIGFAEQVGAEVAELAIKDGPDRDERLSTVLEGYVRLFEQSVEPPAIWVDHLQAPELLPRRPLEVGQVLWELRALRQRTELPLILSGSSSSSTAAVSGASNAFYGDGRLLELGRPGPATWKAVSASLDWPVPSYWVEQMADMTGCHPQTMLLALALRQHIPEQTDDALAAWQLMLGMDDGLTGRAMQHARTLHRLGGRLMVRIAKSERPYGGLRRPSDRKDVDRALEKLHVAGLITRPAPRSWELTNPLIAGRLDDLVPLTVGQAHRSPVDEGLEDEAAPTTTNQRIVRPRDDGRWEVTTPHGRRASTVTNTQKEAIDAARPVLANSGGGELRIHGRDGKLRDSDTIAPNRHGGGRTSP